MLRSGILAVVMILALAGVGGVSAARNPSGSGQPNASCEDPSVTREPAGFGTGGFANAQSHYAGSDGTPSLANAHSDHAVSQYDIACVQVTAAGH